jgi:signal transduction histidine kinase/CheY-like chemotaxis protein
LTEALRPHDANPPDACEAADRLAEVDAHFRVTALSVGAANVAACLIVLTLLWAGALRWETAPVWLAFMFATGGVHIAASVVYRRRSTLGRRWRPWAYATAAITLVEGLGWGGAPFAVPSPDNRAAMFLVVATTLCIAAGSVIGYGRYLPSRVIAFVAPTLPFLIYCAFDGDRLLRGAFFLILVFLVALGRLGLEADLGFRREAEMRKRNARLAEDLLAQKEAAERANLAKSRFLAAASHDLRQPIHALGLYIGALRNAALTPDLLAIAGRMETSIEAMDRLFAAILDISRLDAGVVEVRAEVFALDQLVAPVCEEFREEARRKGLRLSCEPGGGYVYADRVLLERILRNLLSNAVRYTDQGEVRVRSRARAGWIALQVWDTGCGVAKADLPLIFEEYFQVGNNERDREKGLGLGLAIVRRLTTLLGAEVGARSRLGRGSCFEVRLPMGRTSDASVWSAPAEGSAAPEAGLVVVADDEAAVRDAMGAALSGWGYEVLATENGCDALADLETSGLRPALLVCDLRLRKGEDGLAVVAQFRARFGAEFPAVLMTGDTAPERVAQAHASDICLLHKPVSSGKLRAIVRNLARSQTAAGQERDSDAETSPATDGRERAGRSAASTESGTNRQIVGAAVK